MNFPGRPRTEARNQLLLNLARDDVKEYVFQWLDQLVSDNDIAFLKWDYNRNWSEPGWDAVAPEDQKKIYVAYVRNLYDILDRLRAKHPKLEIESCSGAAAASISASCAAPKKCGPRITPTRWTGSRCRMASPRRTPPAS